MNFNEKLKQVMHQLNINQAQLVGMTGIGKSSISQYLSGKNVPTEERQVEIAVSLGLDQNYFKHDSESVSELCLKVGVIPQIRTDSAGKLMRMNHQTIEAGLKQGEFDWGYAILMPSGKYRYFINAKSFSEIEHIEIPLEMVV